MSSKKTDPDNPKWYMVDVTFKSRAKHYVPLPLLRHIAVSPDLSKDMSYIGTDAIAVIKGQLNLFSPKLILTLATRNGPY